MKDRAQAWLLLIAVVLTVLGAWQRQSDSQPDPKPEPAPVPVLEPGSWIVLLEETQERTPAVAIMVEQFARREADKHQGWRWRSYDRDLAGAADLVAAATEAGVALPVVLLLKPDKELLRVVPLPGTMAELDSLLAGGDS